MEIRRGAAVLAMLGAVGACQVAAAQRVSAQERVVGQRQFEYTIDTSASPELKEWADGFRPIIDKWYPIIFESLPSEGYTAPKKFTITFKPMNGVAYTSGTDVVGATAWFAAHPDDRGAIIHELAHVVQQYHRRGNPGWLVEGLADYIRWFKYEPKEKRPRPNPARANYTDSYRTTAAFLEYVVVNYDHETAVRLNEAMREGRYTPELWKEYTGKSVEELWDEYLKTLQKV